MPRGKLLFFAVLLCEITHVHTAIAFEVTCPDPQSCGAMGGCSSGSYCNLINTSCDACPSDFPYSDDSNATVDCCYTTCPEKTIYPDGDNDFCGNIEFGWDSSDIVCGHYVATTVWYKWAANNSSETCTYPKNYETTRCIEKRDAQNKLDKCTSFYKECNESKTYCTCVAYWQSFSDDDGTHGYLLFDGENPTSENRCITICPDGTLAKDSGTELCGETCKICIPEELNCNDGDPDYKDVIIPGTKCPNGTISGKIKWDDVDGVYDYSECTCKSEGPVNFGTNDSAGRGTFTCKGYDHSKGTWDTCNVTYESCPIGRCSLARDVTLENVSIANACPDAPTGYYHSDEYSWSCSACPLGSTTHGPRRTSINQCVMVGPEVGPSDVPQFCDNIGCFTLPAETKIYYAGNEALQNGTQ